MKNSIRKHRKLKGLTQSELAVLISAHQTTIAAYENGTRKPGIYKAQQLADVLGVSVSELFKLKPSVAA